MESLREFASLRERGSYKSYKKVIRNFEKNYKEFKEKKKVIGG